jgi:hypothetical protein
MGLKTKSAGLSSQEAMHRYESMMLPLRSKITGDPLATYVLTFDDPVLRELFLVYFCALGVGMTEPVEDWIRRAGERCEELGLSELGKFLKAHAKHEAGHHLMMIEDTEALVSHWNARRTPHLDAKKILGLPLPAGVMMYRQLHEDTIAGMAPFAQIAIEYEIERLSVDFGPRLIQKCVGVLGPSILQGLSFIKEHVAIDVAHTRFNEEQLGKLLAARPEFLTALVEAGEKALVAYKAFVGDVLYLAKLEATTVGSRQVS